MHLSGLSYVSACRHFAGCEGQIGNQGIPLTAKLMIGSLRQGRVACEVNAGDELVTTEIIFAGVLSELSPEEAVAVLSALVFQAS